MKVDRFLYTVEQSKIWSSGDPISKFKILDTLFHSASCTELLLYTEYIKTNEGTEEEATA